MAHSRRQVSIALLVLLQRKDVEELASSLMQVECWQWQSQCPLVQCSAAVAICPTPQQPPAQASQPPCNRQHAYKVDTAGVRGAGHHPDLCPPGSGFPSAGPAAAGGGEAGSCDVVKLTWGCRGGVGARKFLPPGVGSSSSRGDEAVGGAAGPECTMLEPAAEPGAPFLLQQQWRGGAAPAVAYAALQRCQQWCQQGASSGQAVHAGGAQLSPCVQ